MGTDEYFNRLYYDAPTMNDDGTYPKAGEEDDSPVSQLFDENESGECEEERACTRMCTLGYNVSRMIIIGPGVVPYFVVLHEFHTCARVVKI